MNTPVRILQVFGAAAAAFTAMVPRTQSEIFPGADIHIYAGLTITGAVGTVYSIDYVRDLVQTNDQGAWRCLEFLQLPASPYLWVDRTTPATGQRFYRAVVFPAPTNMVFIPPGTFVMGSPMDEVDRFPDEGPQTTVTISRAFWMGKYEVTQREYLTVMGNNPSGSTPGLNHPVFNISWFDATNYCSRLTDRERISGRNPNNSDYRLPTEAEWEYACRAWTSTRFSYGDDPGYTLLDNYGWRAENSGGRTHPVGEKLANPWGLHDLHGNLFEWCSDWWTGKLPGGVVVDPQGPADGSARVYRGGSYFNFANFCRPASRSPGTPGNRNTFRGFRVVLAPGQP